MKAQKDIRILAIDDEQIFLHGVKLGFAISGFKDVRVESDPRKVVTILESEEEFDIALIDITMPFINGIELLELIKKMSPNTKCIMVSASVEAGIEEECMQKGAVDFLCKPVTKEDLILAINRVVK